MDEFLQKTGDWISSTYNSVKDELSSDGAHNYLWAVPGGILGFMFTQNIVGSWFGGGLIAQIAAIPLSLCAGMAGAVWAARGVNATYDWAINYFDGVTSDGKAKAEPEVAPERALAPEESLRPQARKAAHDAAIAVVSATSAIECLNDGNSLIYDVQGANVNAALPFIDVNEEEKIGACVAPDDVNALAVSGVTFKVFSAPSRGVQ